MQHSSHVGRVQSHPVTQVVRRVLVPSMALAAVALTASTAMAFARGTQAKPQLTVEAERSPQGAKLTLKGKGWTPMGRIKITGTRAPGTTAMQDLGMYSVDSTGAFTGRKVIGCSTSNMEDGQNESVTITAADSASGVKVQQKVQGGAWVCQ